jgi:hypothetical protein
MSQPTISNQDLANEWIRRLNSLIEEPGVREFLIKFLDDRSISSIEVPVTLDNGAGLK